LGAQLIVGGRIRLIVPAAPVTGNEFPSPSDALAGLLTIAILLFLLAGEIWKVAVASVPSGMLVWFSPQARQVAAEIP
jgi:hypothetical protein